MSMQLKQCNLQMTVLAATVHVKQTLQRGSTWTKDQNTICPSMIQLHSLK